MPKGNRRIRNTSEVPAVQSADANIPPVPQPVIVVTGGTPEKPVRENALTYAAVTVAQIMALGTSKRDVLKGLAMNLLAGTTLETAIVDRDSDVWSERSLRTEKTAFFYLVDVKGGPATMRTAWASAIASRKRYDAPTLQALSKATRRYLAAGEGGTASPIEKFARKILAILNDPALAESEKIRSAIYHLREKAPDKSQGEAAQVSAAMPEQALQKAA